MWNLFKKKEKIVSCCNGKVINITEVNDEAFSSKMLGEGYAIIPTSNDIISPISGKIEVCFPTGHAFGIVNGEEEIIVHIGIDTVNLNGEGFHLFVKQGDSVKQGDKLVTVDFDLIKEKGYDTTVIVVFSNGKTPTVSKVNQDVKEGEEIATL